MIWWTAIVKWNAYLSLRHVVVLRIFSQNKLDNNKFTGKRLNLNDLVTRFCVVENIEKDEDEVAEAEADLEIAEIN